MNVFAYENLRPGQKYAVKAELAYADTYDQDATKGSPVKAASGEDVIADAELTPNNPDDFFSVNIKVPGSAVFGRSVVAYETIYDEAGNVIAEHKDVNDEEQTVDYPKIRTHAEASDGGKIVRRDENEVLIDTVTYENLTPGTEYTIRGVLMNKQAQQPVFELGGEDVTAEAKFVPKDRNGSVDVTFVFNGGAVETCQGVVFEKLYIDDALVASHEDYNDEDQTVSCWGLADANKQKDQLLSNTMDWLGDVLAIALLAAVPIACGIYLYTRRKN